MIIVDIQSLCNHHGIIISTSLIFFLLHSVGAQLPSTPPPPGQFPYQFNPSVAAIIIVLIAALFFMGFFSVYIRQCYDISPNNGGNSVRRAGGIGASLRRRGATRGLDQTVIENLPTFPYSEVKELKIGKGALECAVCLNEFDDEEILRLLPKCDHVFHPECIDAWLKSHVTCPVCRSDLAAQTDETPVENPESIPEPPVENPVVEEVAIQIDEERIDENDRNRYPQLVDRARSFNQIRPPPVSKSIRGWPFWSKFPRSHSTGHSLVQPGENTDRFTLR
ncbi:E3 ubiquitin-protein ligase ATL31 [Impatiens glandulifera]|uniref:E3 ubiquitin-protein ligase ATL31 n=1 Tax=Impatiens glandulifera TaxID=253017 RepID=UPI001FB1A13A|nr:E3 ubiquitin-protein ligase ATL31 [Impatiens glandulifera]